MEYLYTRIGAKCKEYAYALNYRGEDSGKCTPVMDIKKRIAKGEK